MNRLLYVAIAVACAGLVGSVAYGAAATVSPVQWEVEVPFAQVGYGQGIPIYVIGPAGGSFNVTLSVAPFNHTFPAFQQSYTLPVPNGTNSSQEPYTASYLNVSVPTYNLFLGAFQVLVVAGGTSFISVVRIVDPVNATVIQEEIDALNTVVGELTVAVDQANAQIATANEQALLAKYVAVVFGALLAIIATLFLFTRTPARNTRPGDWINGALQKIRLTLYSSTRYVDNGMRENVGPVRVREIPADAKWKSTCAHQDFVAFRRTVPELTEHYRGRLHERKAPIREGADYVLFDDAEEAKVVTRVGPTAGTTDSGDPRYDAEGRLKETP